MPKVYRLHYGSSKQPIAEVVPDTQWPDMWRIQWADCRLSDMANLSRARDAALAIAERGPPVRNRQLLQWQIEPVEEPLRRPLVSPSGREAA